MLFLFVCFLGFCLYWVVCICILLCLLYRFYVCFQVGYELVYCFEL